MQANPSLMPVLFVPHGGGPLPLLGDPNHQALEVFLSSLAVTMPKPRAILVITAHWEAAQVTLSNHAAPSMIFDYYGFPPEAYQFCYPAPGESALAKVIVSLLSAKGIETRLEARGFDHGTFVPLTLMFPEATIPVVQMSLLEQLDPKAHIEIGEALAPLREQGVLIVGSGMSFHNMRAFFANDPSTLARSREFDTWLTQVLTSGQKDAKLQLIDWQAAPQARFSHPREEHLLPLLVCFGAAKQSAPAVCNFNDVLFNALISGYCWQ